MKKVFLYLYPIKEYTEMFLLSEDNLYEEWNIKRPLPILNNCIQKRYRDNGYQVVFVLYPDKDIFGLIPKEEDQIIYTDILFSEASKVDENKNIKKDFKPKYPNEQLLLSQLGDVEELVIGGYHAQDCVKRIGEQAIENGINTIIDLDMTDFFFQLYRQEEYFRVEQYDPSRYKTYAFSKAKRYGEKFIERKFEEVYSSKAYGFDSNNRKAK